MMVSVGYENFLPVDKILAVVEPESAPIKRLRRDASEKGCLIDCTLGRRSRCVIIMSTHHVVLSALSPSTLIERLNSQNKKHGKSASIFARQAAEEHANSLAD